MYGPDDVLYDLTRKSTPGQVQIGQLIAGRLHRRVVPVQDVVAATLLTVVAGIIGAQILGGRAREGE